MVRRKSSLQLSHGLNLAWQRNDCNDGETKQPMR